MPADPPPSRRSPGAAVTAAKVAAWILLAVAVGLLLAAVGAYVAASL